MADRPVAMHTVEFFLLGANTQNVMQEINVTVQAALLHYPTTHFAHLNRLMKILQRKAFRVPETVFRLRVVLAYEIVWQMAVDAFGHTVVATFLPAIELWLHDMAVNTCPRIRAEVREALGVFERVETLSQSHAHDHRQQDTAQRHPPPSDRAQMRQKRVARVESRIHDARLWCGLEPYR